MPVDEHDLAEACPFAILLKYALHVHLDNPLVVGFSQVTDAASGNQLSWLHPDRFKAY